LTDEALADASPAVAALRISVFREWPYLYDGDLVYAPLPGVEARSDCKDIGAASGTAKPQQFGSRDR
jgi:hypothetical protein